MLLLLGCVACSPDDGADDRQTQAQAAPSPTVPPPVAPQQEKEADTAPGRAAAFSYAVPGAVGPYPALARHLAADRRTARAALAADQAEAGRDVAGPFEERTEWRVVGETPLLLSLVAETYRFTGGAHGMTSYRALLWDKPRDREVALRAIVRQPDGALAAVTPAYCRALDAERAERRDGRTLVGFDDCPALGEQVLAPLGRDRFDRLGVWIAPYEAGPYVEGSYELVAAVPQPVVAQVAPRYRDAFLAQGQ